MKTPRSRKAVRSELPYPLLLVEWEDSSRLGDGWIDLGEVRDPAPHRCVSVGYLVKSNRRGKVIVPTIADVEHPENSHAHGGIMIPSCAILSVRRLS